MLLFFRQIVTYCLIKNEQGEPYGIISEQVDRYLRKKAAEIVNAGANVILDWDFGQRKIDKTFLTSSNQILFLMNGTLLMYQMINSCH